MKSSEQLDQLLKQALSATVEPGDELNRSIINQFKERRSMKPTYSRKAAVALVAAAIIVVMSITTYAAWYLLSSKQVAEHFGNKILAQAFEDKDAIEVNKSVASGGYVFTLLGIVSGKGLSDFGDSSQDIRADRTYAVVSIEKEDGSKMPNTRDSEYGKDPFFISPLIKGQKPWQVNIASMNGGYSECVIDGIMYRLIECDGIEMFADRGLYLCISTSSFYDIHAFNYDEETGLVSPNPDYSGANALFDLPLSAKKADHSKADKYLQELLKPASDTTAGKEKDIDYEKVFADAAAIPESIKQVTYDKYGMACYEYEGYSGSFDVDSYFKKGETGSKIIWVSGEGKEQSAVHISRDADGIVTGRILAQN
ncbi:MAG: hypothetical protein ACM3MK_03940 [Chitinophagales bacterium]